MVDVAATAAMDVVQRTGYLIWDMQLDEEESDSDEDEDEDDSEDILESDDDVVPRPTLDPTRQTI